jgi:Protein of unknown function (DUF1194)
LRPVALFLSCVVPLLSPAAFALDAPVDVALVLAVDVSGSISDERFRLQMKGCAEALMNDQVLAALSSGPHKAAAVTLVEWAGPNEQQQTIPWTRIADESSARGLASQVAEAPRLFRGITAIGAAITYSAGILDREEFAEARRVIDVSGDGANNGGAAPGPARDAAVASGITINGLAILGDEPGLDRHYRSEVIGGKGAFVIVVENIDDFSWAVIRKLAAEIAEGRESAMEIHRQ